MGTVVASCAPSDCFGRSIGGLGRRQVACEGTRVCGLARAGEMSEAPAPSRDRGVRGPDVAVGYVRGGQRHVPSLPSASETTDVRHTTPLANSGPSFVPSVNTCNCTPG